ncbi:MAG: 1,6-anhydro-N-acetylmuramyl-L-alanine amidase AmpD [Duodenibacillus sp.]|nr:1,6-anhydro-N-acetylmuramyl-L-alanine amidase AmpD [Duodenibacillus sp.]
MIRIGADGWAEGCARLPSPFCDERPQGAAIDTVVLHNISLPPGCFGTGCVEELFTGRLAGRGDPRTDEVAKMRVSSHFFIGRGGAVTQFVACGARAWHAGLSEFGGRRRFNDFSIGVELEGTDFEPFEEAQYAALAELLAALAAAYPLRAALAHSDIAPGRKTDPGAHFDWRRVRAAGRFDLPGAAARQQA